MDIVGLVKRSYSDYGTILKDSWYTIIAEELRENVRNVLFLVLIVCNIFFSSALPYTLPASVVCALHFIEFNYSVHPDRRMKMYSLNYVSLQFAWSLSLLLLFIATIFGLYCWRRIYLKSKFLFSCLSLLFY